MELKSKKIFLVFLVTALCISIAAASWYFIFNGTIKVNVASIGSYKEAILNFNDMNLNTTAGSGFANTSMTFVYNRAGTFRADIIETTADLSNGECLNGKDDCTVEYFLFDGINGSYRFYDKQNLTLPNNPYLKKISVNMTCVAYSCPQTRDISVKLTQVA